MAGLCLRKFVTCEADDGPPTTWCVNCRERLGVLANPYHPDEYGGGRKLCPTCEAPIAERQQTCAECYDPDEQCSCGALTAMGPYGVRYSVCNDCADGREPDGEAFRGGEAAAYQAEQQAWIQRNLK